MAKDPLISVVMTAYNSSKYIEEAIASILSQSLDDFEYIIVDDGSSDTTPDILKRFAARDSRIRLVFQANKGVARAANAGIALAKGKYLARMDSDDVAMPERFAKQVAYLDVHPDCVLLGSRVMLTDPYGSPVAVSGHALDHETLSAQIITGDGGWALCNPTTMIPMWAIDRIGAYREKCFVCEDHDLFIRLSEIGRVANLPEILLWYRRHYKSINHTQFELQFQLMRSIVADAYERRGQPMPANWNWSGWQPQPYDAQLLLWGWAALKAGNITVARKHAFNALKQSPRKSANWKLLFHALRGS